MTPTEPAPIPKMPASYALGDPPDPTRVPGPGILQTVTQLDGEIVEVPPQVKPGYRTTEFWLSLAAMVLTTLYASGIIPTSGAAAAIAAMAATTLTGLGYKVSRTLVKTAGAAALALLVLGATLPACSWTRSELKAGGSALIDCAAADHAKIDALIVDLGTKRKQDGSRDWAAIETEAIAAGWVIGGCALVELVTQSTAASSGLAARTGSAPDPGQAALERARAHWGDVRWSTTEGVR